MTIVQDFLAALFLVCLGICALGMYITGQLPAAEAS